MAHGDGLSPTYQLGAALSEVHPAPLCDRAGPSIGLSVPTFHGENAPAIADLVPLPSGGSRKRRESGRVQPIVDRNFDPDALQVVPESLHRFQRSHPRIMYGGHISFSRATIFTTKNTAQPSPAQPKESYRRDAEAAEGEKE